MAVSYQPCRLLTFNRDNLDNGSRSQQICVRPDHCQCKQIHTVAVALLRLTLTLTLTLTLLKAVTPIACSLLVLS
jgi:hypothetical protein